MKQRLDVVKALQDLAFSRRALAADGVLGTGAPHALGIVVLAEAADGLDAIASRLAQSAELAGDDGALAAGELRSG